MMYQFLINNVKISSRLTAAFAFLLLLVVLLGGLAFESINTLNDLMSLISNHPLKVIEEAQQVKIGVVTIQRDITDSNWATSKEDAEAMARNISKMEQELNVHLEVLRSEYLGPVEDVAQLTYALTNWRRLLDETLSLERLGGQIEFIARLDTERRRYAKEANDKIQDILNFGRTSAKSLQEAAAAEKKKIIIRLVVALLGLIILGVLLTRLIIRSITQPLDELRRRMSELAVGDLSMEIPFQHGKSELTAMACAVQVFKDSALKLEGQRWVKSTLSQLSMELQTTNSSVEFSQRAIAALVPRLGGGVGVFYIWDETKEHLVLLGSYGLKKRRHLTNSFKLGEGLAGQCALERSTIILTEVPEDYVRIASGLGEALPRIVMVAPVIAKDKVLAVVEIGSFLPFTPEQETLIDEVLPIISFNLEILDRNNRAQMLLVETQRQAEALRVSEEELRSQSDQLQTVNEELRLKTDSLQQQAEALRASEEELRAQREELRATNEALEEKSERLESQAKLLEQARSEADRRALERDTASRYKSEFLANMSHELRTPLNSLLILSRFLKDNEEGNLTSEQVESAEIIHESGTSLLRLINDILDLSKVEAGKMKVVNKDIDLDQFCALLLQRFKPLAESKGLSLLVTSDEDSPKLLRSDPGKLEQIVNNLLGNAIKFTEKGSVSVQIKRGSDEAVAIEINDTGIGIPAEKIESIFQAFQQVDGSSSRIYGGTGLGLTISLRLAQLLGGDIHVTSTEGQGSRFTLILPLKSDGPIEKTVSLPLDLAQHPDQSSVKLEGDHEKATRQGETILVIEDDEAFAKIVCDISRRRGFKCLIASDGLTGLDLAKRHCPTGIVLDVGLPGMDGWTVMERLKQQPETRHIPVHFMSATDSGQRGLEMGAVGYFTKPVSKEQIESAFERIRHFASSSERRVLLVDDDVGTHKAVASLLDNKNVEIISETNGQAALARLEKGESFDCMILDLGLPDISGLNLLKECSRKHLIMPPVIVYSGRDLSDQDNLALREYTDSIVIKGARSPERLLDEVTLFLHSVHKSLPASQQQILRKLHEKEEDLAGRSVLVVDDDMRNTFALSKVLRAKGLNVLMAQDGLKALSQLQEKPDTDLVLMDIMMPGMDGFMAIREIRKQPCFEKLPIIALTAKAMLGDKEKCLEAGANDYLSKPVDIDDLVVKMRHCLSLPD